MRVIEIRLLEGPNVYRLEPAVKLEVVVGRRRTWFGQRMPGAHARVRLGASIPRSGAPRQVQDLAAWVGRLHRLAGSVRPRITLHQSSEPGHWIVAWPWAERGRAETIAEAAVRLVDLDLDPERTKPTESRSLTRALRAIGEAGTEAPPWIRDADRRVPAVSISGTNGKTTTTRMLTHILRVAGRHVGTTTSEGVLFDEQVVEEGDLTGPLGARRVLEDPRIEIAVLETARGGIVLKGIGYESNDVSILTNVSSDHMDLQGLHTLPELAEVKSVIARITRPGGLVVLNAEDPLVAEVARRVRAPVCLFSMRPRSPKVRRHVGRGGRAMVFDGGWLVELEGSARRPVAHVDAVPSTLGGLARHNVANALAAAAGARGLGISLKQVAAGLADFRPTSDQMPGRLNFYRNGNRAVMVDFAHNEAGLGVAIDAAEALTGDRAGRNGRARLSVIVGTAGDRPDDTLRGLGRIAATRADQVAIKESLKYLRGRTRESVIGELRAGAAEAGVRAAEIPIYEDEAIAVRGELCDEARMGRPDVPGLLLLMCHQDRAEVLATLEDLGFQPMRIEEIREFRKALSNP